MQTNRTLSLSVLAASVTCLAPMSQAATIFSDDFSTNTLASYAQNGGSGHTYSAAAGVGGGGGGILIDQGQNDSSTFVPSGSFSVGTGSANAVTISMMLKSIANGGGSSKAFIGLSDSAANAWGGNPPPDTSTIGGVLQDTDKIGARAGGDGGARSGSASKEGERTKCNLEKKETSSRSG